ncbi:NAD-P-binding protein [Epithele typhae]|uniref:NAD-P-binding protein n=1 Tax=Epithele typhae TaxID=378194 RepID=UPI0020075BDF|nr:NAD-P-binding protein [Epithele typhae]KAH9915045.1 NAD-P-binding protein [Epithele typhae]
MTSDEQPTPETQPTLSSAAAPIPAPAISLKTELPKTQKSWRPTAKGKPADVLKLREDTPIPPLTKGTVLVKVHAVALNPVGYKVLDFLPGFLLRRIQAHEFDLAGVVVDGNGTDFKPGDEIFGSNPVPVTVSSGWGSLAQYARVQAGRAVLRPACLTPVQAAGIPIAGLTAYQALQNIGALKPGQRVFVNGGSTAVGAWAIQLAKAWGARVVGASTSAKNEQYVRGCGADVVYDYAKAPLHEQLISAAKEAKEKAKEGEEAEGVYDVFFEAVGFMDPALFVHSAAYLAPKGVFVSVGPQGPGLPSFLWNVMLKPGFLGGTKRKWKLVNVDPIKKDLEAFAKLCEEGKVKPLVDSVFAFEDALKAYERVMTGRATGKVVIKVDSDSE